MTELVLVIPVFNEAARFDADPWLAYLAAHAHASLCFVNDGSSDHTASLLAALQARAPERIRIMALPANAGKAEAVRQGMAAMLEGTATFVGFVDADLSAPLSEVALLEGELASAPLAWAAFGSRIKLLGRRIVRSERRHYLGRVFATFASLALALPVYDTQCGLKLFRNLPPVRDAFAAPFASKWIFDVELLARLSRTAGSDVSHRIHEVPLRHWEERGASRLRARDWLAAPLELISIRRAYRRTDR